MLRSYRSPITSLRGLVVTTDEPICSLHILLSTESNGGATTNEVAWHHPDDGLPHTLEHLVFLGSLTHPHKGILDKLANRCMADGTNAWTATDHTGKCVSYNMMLTPCFLYTLSLYPHYFTLYDIFFQTNFNGTDTPTKLQRIR